MFNITHPKYSNITWRSEENQKRINTIMLIMNYINRDVNDLEFMKDKSDSEKAVLQEYITILRNLLIEEMSV